MKFRSRDKSLNNCDTLLKFLTYTFKTFKIKQKYGIVSFTSIPRVARFLECQ